MVFVLIVDRSLLSVTQVFLKLDKGAHKIGFEINEGKSKIMVSRRKRHDKHVWHYVFSDQF